ncbi:MAG: decaprenyl-phosphate phosphoribosyltransferase [Chloroflexi bacterium]|nr:decaprenyl-phosphate phosphoribosyltransferase [Chloroflexota bacterium]MQC26045.1 decaprenyl-phosphate phosphoribosyltransferase [Chloroflexota bacterium]
MFSALIKNMRLKQWAKNGLLFAGLIFDRQLTNWPSVLITLEGFLLFGLLSSGVYLLNDLIDLEADRRHPRKRSRPIASGKLAIPVAVGAAILFFASAFFFGYRLSPAFALVALISLLLNLSYSLWLKHIPILDVIVLASFYVLRVAAGVTLVDVQRFSPWLYVFTTFMALFLGVAKRRAELALVEGGRSQTRRVLAGYTAPFLDQMLQTVLTLAILTYSLYTFSAPNLPENHAMMLTIPFVIYGAFRYLYLVQVMNSGEAPEEILFSDRPIQATVLLWGLTVLYIFYTY